MNRDKEELKTSFTVREGSYKLVSLPDYIKTNRGLYVNNGSNPAVRISFVSPAQSTVSSPSITTNANTESIFNIKNVSEGDKTNLNENNQHESDGEKTPDSVNCHHCPTNNSTYLKTDNSDDYYVEKICLNYGKEMYIYPYCGLSKGHSNDVKPIDKRTYKAATLPTCHDFNEMTACSESLMLLIGFNGGQVQLIDTIQREKTFKVYNEEKIIDKTRVNCIKWVPSSSNQFLVAHASGQMYLYNEELPCGATAPNYQLFKSGNGFVVHTCKTKSTRNPLYRWVIGQNELLPAGINQFAFSPCGRLLALVSQDGFLRLIDYHAMELQGNMRSYFGGLLCVAWSADGRYLAVGGEDDLVTVWSVQEKQVVCRGEGHRSWVNVVRFDPYLQQQVLQTDTTGNVATSTTGNVAASTTGLLADKCADPCTSSSSESRSYRIGSVGQDTMLCLWELSEDILKQSLRAASGVYLAGGITAVSAEPLCATGEASTAHLNNSKSKERNGVLDNTSGSAITPASGSASLSQRLAALTLPSSDKEAKRDLHRRNFSLSGGKSNHVKPAASSGARSLSQLQDNSCSGPNASGFSACGTDSVATRLLGTTICPRISDVPCLEPLVAKRVANERITELLFRPDHIVIACQEGFVYTWARPSHSLSTSRPCDKSVSKNNAQWFPPATSQPLSSNSASLLSPSAMSESVAGASTMSPSQFKTISKQTSSSGQPLTVSTAQPNTDGTVV